MYVSACRTSLTKRDLVLQVGGLRWANYPLVKKTKLQKHRQTIFKIMSWETMGTLHQKKP